ncbi:MAG: nitrous oxide reductase family maturation protein NosD [Deltaproteobacteria bacterium]|nr:nitrous oxide reductase family maturation protein NosD [Deltaproteobacteria bacterium]
MKLFLSFMTLFGFLFLTLPGSAAILEVCPACPIRSIRQAVEQAKEGDTLRVHTGEYREGTVVIRKPLHLVGIGIPIVDGLKEGNVFWIRADTVTIEGFVIQNSGASYIAEFAGIRAEEAKNCTLQNNRFENNTYSIYLAKVDTCRVEGNKAHGNALSEVSGGNGVHLWSSKNITIRNNLFENHRDGIYIEFSGDSLIESNISRLNIRYGLHFMYSHRNRYLNNTFSKNQTGVAVMYSRGVEMIGNRFEKSWGRTSYGLLLKDISDSIVKDNTFYGNTVGLFADEISRITFSGNDFVANGWAINILGNSETNRFTKNNFVSNYFDVSTNAKSPLNIFEFNYWSDYKGYDLNRDGQGDIPFRPMGAFSVWINHYPELVALLASPIIEFLNVAERVFPVLTPETLEDKTPSMKPILAIK